MVGRTSSPRAVLCASTGEKIPESGSIPRRQFRQEDQHFRSPIDLSGRDRSSPANLPPIPRRFHRSASEIRTSASSFKREELRKRPVTGRGLPESDSSSAKYLLAAASSQQWLSAWLPWAGWVAGGCNRRIENGMENANVLLSCVPQSSPKRPALILNAAVARSSALLATFTN